MQEQQLSLDEFPVPSIILEEIYPDPLTDILPLINNQTYKLYRFMNLHSGQLQMGKVVLMTPNEKQYLKGVNPADDIIYELSTYADRYKQFNVDGRSGFKLAVGKSKTDERGRVQYWLVLAGEPFYPYPSLKAILQRHPERLESTEIVMGLLSQILDILLEHGGLATRLLLPSNIFLTEAGTIRINNLSLAGWSYFRGLPTPPSKLTQIAPFINPAVRNFTTTIGSLSVRLWNFTVLALLLVSRSDPLVLDIKLEPRFSSELTFIVHHQQLHKLANFAIKSNENRPKNAKIFGFTRFIDKIFNQKPRQIERNPITFDPSQTSNSLKVEIEDVRELFRSKDSPPDTSAQEQAEINRLTRLVLNLKLHRQLCSRELLSLLECAVDYDQASDYLLIPLLIGLRPSKFIRYDTWLGCFRHSYQYDTELLGCASRLAGLLLKVTLTPAITLPHLCSVVGSFVARAYSETKFGREVVTGGYDLLRCFKSTPAAIRGNQSRVNRLEEGDAIHVKSG